eukprot:TRINITY_DN9979_c1_g1_i1.p2 TRINITY_DN9979_c1_g1~~TRINITY_DN9979_c1_g1_i1.p2  ORF type:complete len:214 (+),score=-6.71 TRINITY_DN9979_c1_g1_i1:50-643(+)
MVQSETTQAVGFFFFFFFCVIAIYVTGGTSIYYRNVVFLLIDYELKKLGRFSYICLYFCIYLVTCFVQQQNINQVLVQDWLVRSKHQLNLKLQMSCDAYICILVYIHGFKGRQKYNFEFQFIFSCNFYYILYKYTQFQIFIYNYTTYLLDGTVNRKFPQNTLNQQCQKIRLGFIQFCVYFVFINNVYLFAIQKKQIM